MGGFKGAKRAMAPQTWPPTSPTGSDGASRMEKNFFLADKASPRPPLGGLIAIRQPTNWWA